MTSRDRDRRLPPVVADLPGHVLKPDPLTARSMAELEERLRLYWQWSGSPSTRKVAESSHGAFCHTTASKLLRGGSKKPHLSLGYLCGFVRGCGGDEEEAQRWATAWRRIHLALPRHGADGEEGPLDE
ncbi:hypothetical protein [Actinomadura sp. 9N215]|uniref:hypothetical protein n=1 Tax=Actinomadura sp. 9N215 TaxID=3375150 RepID=UPI0037B326D6